MRLSIMAQDISSVTFGLQTKDGLRCEKQICVSPEGYLSALHETMTEWGMRVDDVDEIVVVTGPGSFTASRVSTTMANALGFARNIPVYGVENPTHLTIQELSSFERVSIQKSAVPFYDRPPEITVSRTQRGDKHS